MHEPKTLREISCADDYDPNSMPVDRARELIRRLPRPGARDRARARPAGARPHARRRRRLADRRAGPRQLGDGRLGGALRGSCARTAKRTLARIGESFAGKPFAGQRRRRAGGAHLHRRRDAARAPTRSSCRSARRRRERRVTIAAGAVTKPGQNRRFAGEDLKRGDSRVPRGQPLRPAEVGMIASLGINEVGVYPQAARRVLLDRRRAGVDRHAARRRRDLRQQPLHDLRHADAAGLRGPRHGRRAATSPRRSSARSPTAARSADVVITSGGVSVGEADFVKQLLDKLGEVLFWKIAMKPGRPLAYGRIGDAHFFGLPGNPVSVMVTFYQFVRDALLDPAGPARRRADADVPGDARQRRSARCPGRTEFQRGILAPDGDGALDRAHDRRPGLGHPVVDVAGELLHRPRHRHAATSTPAQRVDVQLLEGLI